mgnify:CR=1 FL=1
MYETQLKDMIEAAKIAQKVILKVYAEHFKVKIKDDNSPVTLADITADKKIKKYLQKRYPNYGFLTEESKDDESRLNKDYVFIIDPLDGTSDFVAKNNEFTTNIALCYKHEIVVGVVLIPVSNVCYYAIQGQGSYKIENGKTKRIHVSDKTDKLTCLVSRSHMSDADKVMIEKHKDKITKVEPYGSSLKACKIAEGLAEISYRNSAGTKEWDTAAFDIIVKEAGGLVVKPDGENIKYNRVNVKNLEGYIIVNKKENILL